ncbi:MAG: PspA/IM30 family protein [Planctomycetes bacterium]|nr:PspA/IM30 family protein [Planctomycetota bacterium]
MWQRIKRIFRSIIGWFIELGEDPVLILKQNIRDLEDQVPALNENLAMIKAQVTLVEKELRRLNDREAELTAKIKAALQGGRRDIALNYATTLEEVRREKSAQERQLKTATEAFDKAQKMKRVFMLEKEKRIQEAKKALNSKRQAEWNQKVANAMSSFQVAGIDQTHSEMVDKLEREAAQAEAKLEMAMDSMATEHYDIEQDAKKLQANETLRQFEMQMGMAQDISAAPAAPEARGAEKTIGEMERELGL